MSAAAAGPELEIPSGGAPPRHVDQVTAELDHLARVWIDFQQHRKATFQREVDDCKRCDWIRANPGKKPSAKTPHDPACISGALEAIETRLSARLSHTLRRHPLWLWLQQYPGLGGAHTALIIGRIGDPRRFPGQRCIEGHYLPPLYAVGASCPIVVACSGSDCRTGDGMDDARADDVAVVNDARYVCPGVMLAPRSTTGVRSLWHWAGLHALENGRAPRKTKGQRADWEPRVRASVMQKDGLADQIVKHRTPHYRGIYDEAKARLTLRVADSIGESARLRGDAIPLRAAELVGEIEGSRGRPLRLFEADRIAKKIAAKAFLGDLLTEWKRLLALGGDRESEGVGGGQQ